ncbi:MAG: ISAs1 family transposase [Sphaerochaeta sp.]|nr:ISAs1 family transposase [Sphaerochaeta sp.]
MDDTTGTSDFGIEIRDAVGPAGVGRSAGRRGIQRVVSIIDGGVAEPGVSYPLSEIFVMAFFATLGGAETFSEMELFYQCKQKFFSKFLPMAAGIPTSDLLCRVFSLLDAGRFSDDLILCIMEALKQLRRVRKIPKPTMSQPSVEGKEAGVPNRKTDGSLARPIQGLQVYASPGGICLSSSHTAKNAHAIALERALFSLLDLSNTLVSFDSMVSQREVLRAMINSGGDYVGKLNGNQRALLGQCEALFTPASLKRAETDPKLYYKARVETQGKVEQCIYTVAKVKMGELCTFPDWPGMKAVMRFERRTETISTGERSEQIRYYICSVDNDACLCGKAVRDHCQEDEPPINSQVVTVCDPEDVTANTRMKANLLMMRKMSVSLFRMVRLVEPPNHHHSIRQGFLFAFEDLMESMVGCCEDRTISNFLQSSLEKKR